MNVTIFIIVFSGILIVLMAECYFSVPYDKELRAGLQWFMKHNPEAYMVLLD